MDIYLSELQQQFSHLVNKIDDRACDLSRFCEEHKFPKPDPDPKTSATFAQLSQNSLLSLRENWKWLKHLTRALDRHIDSAMNYHLFYQTIHEYKESITQSCDHARSMLQDVVLTGNSSESKTLFNCISNLLALMMDWWQKLDSLVHQSKKIVPIHMSKGGVDMRRPGIALIEFKSKTLHLRGGEDIFVVENVDRFHWMVETVRGDQGRIPAMCCQLTGPDTEAAERAMRLRLEFAAEWTKATKEVGKILIHFILTVFRECNKIETANLNGFDADNKLELVNLLVNIEEMIQSLWSESVHTERLRERIRGCRAALSIYADDDAIDDATKIDINSIFIEMLPLVMENEDMFKQSESDGQEFTKRKKMMNLLLLKYQEFSKYWEVYKCMIENSMDFDSAFQTSNLSSIANRTDFFNVMGLVSSEDNDIWARYLLSIYRNRLSGNALSLPPTGKSSGKLPRHATWTSPEPHKYRKRASTADVWTPPPSIGRNFTKGSNQQNKASPVGLPPFCPMSLPHTSPRSTSSTFNDHSKTHSDSDILIPSQAKRYTELPHSPNNGCNYARLNMGSTKRSTLNIHISADEDFDESGIVSAGAHSMASSPLITSSSGTIRHGSMSSAVFLSPTMDKTRDDIFRSSAVLSSAESADDEGTSTPRSQNTTLISPLALKRSNPGSSSSSVHNERLERSGSVISNTSFPRASNSRRGMRKKSESNDAFGLVTLRVRPSERVISVYDHRQREQISPEQAVKAGIMDEQMITIVDTETQRRYSFNGAVGAGLLQMNLRGSSDFSQSLSDVSQNRMKFTDIHFHVYTVRDPETLQMVDFVEAVKRGLINTKTAEIATDPVKEGYSQKFGRFCNFLEAINLGYVKVRRLYDAVNPGRELSPSRIIVVSNC